MSITREDRALAACSHAPPPLLTTSESAEEERLEHYPTETSIAALQSFLDHESFPLPEARPLESEDPHCLTVNVQLVKKRLVYSLVGNTLPDSP